MAASSSASSLKDYLKRYEGSYSDPVPENKKKRKKKSKHNKIGNGGGIRVVDEDPTWQKPVDEEEEEEEDEIKEAQVTEDIEVKRLKRLEQLRSQRPYLALSDDGSGWVSVANEKKDHVKKPDTSAGLSPLRNNRPLPEEDCEDRKDLGRFEHSDLSPPRRHNHPSSEKDDIDLSPPRRFSSAQTHMDNGDLSPPRKRSNSSLQHDAIDLSPPRRHNSSFKPKDDARKHGLFNKKEMKEEISKKKKEEGLRFTDMDPAMTGRGAEPVYRDNGRVVSKEEYLKLHKKEEKPQEKKLEWGHGLVQKREAEARLKEIAREKDKPFARGSDDPELDKMLKERVRWGDPMAYIVKRKDPVLELEDLGNDEKMKESGFVVPQAIPNHSWLKRGIDPPVNRYGIRPGRHWDGVDRSNGFEKEMFKRQNERKSTTDEAYLWSVADM